MEIFCIDPGHGGIDPGATYGNRHESNDNLNLSLAVEKALISQGHKVILTHRGKLHATQRLTLEQRTAIARDNKADLFVSIHRNDFHDSAAHGIENWLRYNASMQAATAVYESVLKSSGMRNRGLKIGNYSVLFNLPCPGMLLEMGFIKNTNDNALFDKRLNQNAEAIARGMVAALGVPWSDTPVVPLWRVQTGAFSVRANADKLMADLKKDRFDAFIVENTTKRLWRVQIGAFSVRANAENLMVQIKKAGYDAFVVNPQ